MLSGATCMAPAIAGRAVFRIVVSSDSMKKATATSHGSIPFASSVASPFTATILARRRA